MGLFTYIKEKLRMLFKTDAESAFKVQTYLSSEMQEAIDLWQRLEGSAGLKPPWCDGDTRTVRFSNTVARELASLIAQNIDIKVDPVYGGREKADFIQNAIDESFLSQAQDNIEKMIRLGGIMAKWNGEAIDYLTPDRFLVTEFDSNKEITGAVFFSYYSDDGKYFTRAEYHRFDTRTVTIEGENTEEGKPKTEVVKVYKVSNKAFVSDDKDQIGREIPLKKTKWADIEPEISMEGLEKPLFAYLKAPFSNTIDTDSPLGASIFSECIEELRWLDIAMSNMGVETEDSKPIMFVDNSSITYAQNMGIKLPKFVQGLDMGVSADGTVQQWTPTMQVQNRVDSINFILSIISFKCGFESSYFTYDGQQINPATATQIEAMERRTVNTVLGYRDLLDRPNQNGDGRVGFIHDIAYIIDTMATANGEYAPGEYGNYEIYCDFADIQKNKEEDKNFEYMLAQNSYMSKARFLVRQLGMTEDEAVAMVQEAQAESAQAESGGLFGEE